GVRGDGGQVRPDPGQLHPGRAARCPARLPAAPAPGRDRPPHGELRPRAGPPHHGRDTRGKRAPDRGAADGAGEEGLMPPALSRLAVVGLGLLGGSVARAARARGVAREIVAGGSTQPPLARARAAGVVDTTTHDLATGVRGAELVVLCAPAGALPGLVRAAWPHLGAGALLTHVGSVKGPV